MSDEIILEVKPKYVNYVYFSQDFVSSLIIATFISFTIGEFLFHLGLLWVIILFITIFIFSLGLNLFFIKKNLEATSYRIYSDKIDFEEGFINHKYTTIEIKDIKEIHLIQNYLQRFANIGTIKFITAASSSSLTELTFIDVENPREIYMKAKQVFEQVGGNFNK